MVRARIASLFAKARIAGLVALTAWLAACAPIIAPQGVENGTPAIATDAFVTRDGLRLPLRHWDADHPRAVIVALHGMGDYSNAFDAPAIWWAAHGITTIAYDQRGFGRAPNSGLWPGSDILREDFYDCVEAARTRYPGVPVYALGDSMGGAIVLSSLASAEPPRISGAILVAPAVWSRGDMPASYRAALWLTAHSTPWLTVSGKGLNIWPSDNIPMLRALSRDPLMRHETRADAVYGLVNLMDEAHQAPDKLKGEHPPPILIVYGAKDQIIPPAPTEAVIAALGPEAQSRRYEHGYHLLLRDLDAELVWRDIAAWTETGKLP